MPYDKYNYVVAHIFLGVPIIVLIKDGIRKATREADKKKKAKKQNVALYASKPASVPISIVLIALGSVFGLGSLSVALVALILGMAAGDTIQAVAVRLTRYPPFFTTK